MKKNAFFFGCMENNINDITDDGPDFFPFDSDDSSVLNFLEFNVDSGKIHIINEIIESNQDALYFCNSDLIVFRVNSAACELSNMSREQIKGNNIFDVVDDNIITDGVDLIKSVCGQQDKCKHFTSCIIDSNHETVRYKVNVCGFSAGVFLRISNIYDRKTVFEKSDGKLNDEQSFKMLFENMSSGFVYIKPVEDSSGVIVDHLILDLNPSFEMLTGIDREDVINKNISSVLLDLETNWIKKFANSALTGHSYSGSQFFEHLNKHLEIKSYSPRKGYAAVTFNDLKAEMEIRNELKIKSEVSKAFASAQGKDLYSVILNIILKNNKSQYGIFGYVKDNKLICPGVRSSRFVPDGEIDSLPFVNLESDNIFSKCLKSGTQISQEINFDDGIKTVQLCTPVVMSGKVIGMLSTVDPTNGFYSKKDCDFALGLCAYISSMMDNEIRERQYKKDLLEAKNRAEENDKLKSSFLANMSHEVRTPMNSIMGFCNLLAKCHTLNQRQMNYVDFIIQSSTQLLSVVENIMDMSKLQTGQTKINMRLFNVNELMDEVLADNKTTAQNKNLPLLFTHSVPDNEAIIYSDANKLKKILNSLISNAIKFTNTGYVCFGYQIKNDTIEFFVKDTGIGIRKELHSEIFNSFRQAENIMERKYNGVGIGLSIAKGFLELMGGSIKLESSPGVGSVFYIVLPYITQQQQ